MEEKGRPAQDDLAYIKYSAKELLFLHGQKLDNIQSTVQQMQLDMAKKHEVARLDDEVNDIRLNMVHKAELQATRRWATGLSVAVAAALAGAARALGL